MKSLYTTNELMNQSNASLGETSGTSRRAFLGWATTTGLAAGWSRNPARAQETPAENLLFAKLDSPPVLQNPTPEGVDVVWAIQGQGTGWVEYGPTAELGQRADQPAFGLNPYGSRFLSARLKGLTPGKPVYYRTVVAPIHFENAYKITRGEPVASEIYEWTPSDFQAKQGSFAVINDTHEKPDTLKALTERLAQHPADVTIWNGDIFDDIRSEEQIVAQVLRPAGAAFAARQAVLFTSGNHDVRGVAARQLPQALLPPADPTSPGRCFALRTGPLALIGLDTGEDKPDRHPVFAGLANFEPYREAQRDWLAQTLEREEIATAPHLVVFCHIPLWGRPGENGGDTLEGHAYFSRQSQQLWHPLLEKAGAQLVICGHMHEFRYDVPTPEHRYAQIVGGGPTLENATFIRGEATVDRLVVRASNLRDEELGRWEFGRRG